jgi:hypothetical protein
LGRLAVLGRSRATDALAQRVHQIDDVLATRSFFRSDRLAGAFLIDEIDERGFVLVFKLVRLEAGRLLIEDVLGEIELSLVPLTSSQSKCL